MAKQPNLTKYQRGIVNRYYEHQDTIYLSKLGELVGSIALAMTEKEKDRLWKSARDYLVKSKMEPGAVAKICDARDGKALAEAVAKLSRG
jgi:hypothetical protein